MATNVSAVMMAIGCLQASSCKEFEKIEPEFDVQKYCSYTSTNHVFRG